MPSRKKEEEKEVKSTLEKKVFNYEKPGYF